MCLRRHQRKPKRPSATSPPNQQTTNKRPNFDGLLPRRRAMSPILPRSTIRAMISSIGSLAERHASALAHLARLLHAKPLPLGLQHLVRLAPNTRRRLPADLTRQFRGGNAASIPRIPPRPPWFRPASPPPAPGPPTC